MRYLPHTDDDIKIMLKACGLKTLDELFTTVPEICRRDTPLNLPDPFSEWKLNDYMNSLVSLNKTGKEYKCFIGAGSYQHFIPAHINYLLGRSEFTTSYTPYQPEISQGTLQAIYEYQTLTARLLGMDISNASMYDGASALAEALLMALRIKGSERAAVSMGIHPHYRAVISTYFMASGYEIDWIPFGADGRTSLKHIDKQSGVGVVAVQSPNFFGCIEDMESIKKASDYRDAMLVSSFTEPVAFGLYKPPGDYGADIVCGEGQSLGIAQSFGGPGLGMLATRNTYVRYLPGRIVGETRDSDGNRGYVLTLATREQHIRREKATSNICTNQGLCALTAAMYMASLGKTGFRELAKLNYDKSEYMKRAMKDAGFSLPFNSSGFNECVVTFPENFSDVWKTLAAEGIIAGLPLESYYPQLENSSLFCVTETTSRQDIDKLVERLCACL